MLEQLRYRHNIRRWCYRQTGKKIPLNLDGTRHDCPNSSYNKKISQSNSIPPQENNGPGPIIITADELLDDKNIENAKWFIDSLNLRLVGKRIDLLVKNKEDSFQ